MGNLSSELPLGYRFMRDADVLALNRPVSRDYLMGWLWPESNLKRGRGALNTTIHALRKMFAACPKPAGHSGYIVLEEGHYRLSPGVRVWTDVHEFDRRYDVGRSLEKAGRFSAAIPEYKRAIELYRGEFLAEDLYDDRASTPRQRLRGRSPSSK